MNWKNPLKVNFIYIFLAMVVAVFQVFRILNLSIDFDASSNVRTYLPYLVLLTAIPLIIYFFLYVPTLFVVKVSLVIEIKQPVVNEVLNINVYNTYAYTYNRKPKQSSLQVFRC